MTSADDNPFASPHAVQTNRDAPKQIEGASPLDVRGFCYTCGAVGEQDFQQSFYWGRLLVDYSLCQNCLWRRPWQRASLLVNGSLTIAGFLISGYAVILVRLILGGWSDGFARLLVSLGIVVAIATGFLVLANIVLRLFAVFHWYPTSVGRGVYRLTSLNRNFAENYFRGLAEEE
ncbi:hypothetical protein M4951_01385 [Blastopirellula sp. J2-11]|uniref:hypothetical protein n=1 Tax=Blastopirellula sp. J2-11 TaxID=2943192 RepID=UPI0021C8D740|nr:hypothetical protein [Blastopirellula sp. J2-11]UUO06978.1 hypothetical protein M4951_01385 [Blastopirellula sp. J2-11]